MDDTSRMSSSFSGSRFKWPRRLVRFSTNRVGLCFGNRLIFVDLPLAPPSIQYSKIRYYTVKTVRDARIPGYYPSPPPPHPAILEKAPRDHRGFPQGADVSLDFALASRRRKQSLSFSRSRSRAHASPIAGDRGKFCWIHSIRGNSLARECASATERVRA